jgi:hypothetical protein
MTPVKLPKGTKVKDGRIILAGPKPRDAAQARSWAKGGRKKQRCVSPTRARALIMSEKVK